MADKGKLFVDADAFVALVRPDDTNYLRAKNFSDQITVLGFELITSDPAFGEAVTVISQKVGLQEAISFAERVLHDPIEIIEVDAALRRQALDIFKKQTSKNSRFTDCVNMAILKERGLQTIFSFDIQYKQNKFKRFGIDK